jgi:hypothetical protein
MQSIGTVIEQLTEYAQLFDEDRDQGMVFWIK